MRERKGNSEEKEGKDRKMDRMAEFEKRKKRNDDSTT